jgi:hypothetical protein
LFGLMAELVAEGWIRAASKSRCAEEPLQWRPGQARRRGSPQAGTGAPARTGYRGGDFQAPGIANS